MIIERSLGRFIFLYFQYWSAADLFIIAGCGEFCYLLLLSDSSCRWFWARCFGQYFFVYVELE